MKLGLAMQHRPFSFGEGIRGMRPDYWVKLALEFNKIAKSSKKTARYKGVKK